VVIESPNDNLVASLAELPDSLLNANALLKQRCAARAAGTASSFVVTGPGGVPPQPGGLIYSSVPIGKTGLAAQLNGKPKQAFLLSCGKLPVNYL
jgi:large exoprotein involved in heme utilization and adhesion